MDSIIEQQRSYHEERERLLDAMVREMLHKKSSVSEILCLIHSLKLPYHRSHEKCYWRLNETSHFCQLLME